MTRRKAPAGLGARGRALWREMTAKYEFNPAEEGTLLELCHTLSELQRLEASLAEEPMVVLGSRGQPVANPLLADVRAHRLVITKLTRALCLPESNVGNRTSSRRKGRLQSVQQIARNGGA